MKTLPYGTRLTLAYTGIFALALALFCAVAFVTVRYALAAALDVRLKSTATVVSAIPDVRDGVLRMDPDDRRQFVSLLDANRVSGLATARDGTILASTVAEPPHAIRAGLGGPAFRRYDERVGDEIFDVVSFPILSRGRQYGSIAVWASRSVNEEAARVTLRALLIASAAILVLAALIGALLVRRMLQPLANLSALMSEIEASDLSERLAWTGADDELGRLCMAFDRLLDRLESAFDRERRFTADASHELRTPLAVMRAELELALQRERAPEDYRRTLERLLRETQRLESLAESLLRSARSEAVPGASVAVPAGEIAERAVSRIEPLARARRIALDVRRGGDAHIDGDPSVLERAVVALLDNALRFTPERGTIAVSVAATAAAATIAVHDGGPGFSDDALHQATRRFWRDDAARSGPGSGLGLAIVRAAVERYGGTIALRNAAGGGAIVELTLRRARHDD